MKSGRVFVSVTLIMVAMVLAVSTRQLAAASFGQRSAEQDRLALLALEADWLMNEHNAAALEKILASDFAHPVPTGDVLTKAQHIRYSTKHLPPANLKQRFSELKVRIYGDVGLVNGTVISSDDHGNEVNKSVFTDVFVYRDGAWQAVNAQENQIEKRPERK
jgi:hypothetical protein